MEGLTWASSSGGQLETRMELMPNLRQKREEGGGGTRREEERKRSLIGKVSKACT